MRFSYWTPNGLSWDDTRSAAQSAADLGYTTFWYADHFMPNAPEPADGATHEAFTMLAGLALTGWMARRRKFDQAELQGTRPKGGPARASVHL